ncbi:MAG: ABC transporter ATP-binding protein [Candidatus Rokuibacteriota bacterium]|nr:MAG: ABC transporter ATP-binding protein [Candidatus Rokubacteria bacterium]
MTGDGREHGSVLAPALDVEVVGMTKRFGALIALDDVSLRVAAGSFHALLGENGAGKSTLVKCLIGYYPPDAGQIVVARREREIRSPHDAHALGIGMVYQHFTLVPSMTVAENLVMARDDVPAVVRWRQERERLAAFMATVPFKLDLERPAWRLAAGEKQKVEIVKQLYLRRRFMILDEPTSVLTPAEADEVLGMLRAMTHGHQVTVLMITHKFREVLAFADTVSVLRRGTLAGEGRTADLTPAMLAEMMVGTRQIPQARTGRAIRAGAAVEPRLVVRDLVVEDDAGRPAVNGLALAVRPGEILGIAGVSGNGQRELVEAIIGQRRPASGEIRVDGKPYRATRNEIRYHRVLSLPEEPLRNACVPGLSVAENMALRSFDRAPLASGPWLRRGSMRDQAERRIAEFKVQTQGPDAPISTLSGGNVQRAVLARELSEAVSVLIAANPVFGLDFAAVAEIHDRVVAARNAGAAVLLVSEDLDELLELSDRLAVIFGGRIVHETPAASADIAVIGPCMAGHHAAGAAA